MGSKSQNACCPFEPRIVITAAMFILMVGCLLLAVFASDNVPPYIYSRGFKSTTCVLQSSYISANVCCQSAITDIDNCLDKYVYPCGVIEVKYYRSGLPIVGNTLSQDIAILYDSTHSASIVSPIARCSYHHCSQKSYDKRLDEVNDFLDTYNTTDQEIACYFNEDKSTVALLQTTSGVQLMHYILWPTLMIIASSITWLVMYVYLKKFPRSTEDDEDDDDEDDDKAGSETTRALTAMTDTSEEPGDNDYKGTDGLRPTTAANVNLEDTRAGQYQEKRNGIKSAKGKPKPPTYSPGQKPDEYKDGMDTDGKKSPPAPAFYRTPSAVGEGRNSKAGKVENSFNRTNSSVASKSMGKGSSSTKPFNRNTANTGSLPEKGMKKNGDVKMTAID